jgi:hypothetical protein
MLTDPILKWTLALPATALGTEASKLLVRFCKELGKRQHARFNTGKRKGHIRRIACLYTCASDINLDPLAM